MPDRYMSFDPSTFVQGGLLNNVDVEVTAAVCSTFNYQGKADEVPAMRWTLQPLDGGNATDQFLSAGKLSDWQPTPDGERFRAVHEDAPTGLSNSSNWSIMLSDLLKLGYPANKLAEGAASQFVGLQFHVVRKKVEGRAGGGIADNEVMRAARIIKLPWEKGTRTTHTATPASAAATAPAAAPATTSAPAPAAAPASDEIKALVLAAVPKVLNGATTIELPALKKGVFQELTQLKTAQRTAAAKLVENPEFLAECMLSLEGSTVSTIQL